MTDPIRDVERETMLVNRHSFLRGTGAQPAGARLERSAYVLMNRIEAEGPMSIPRLQEAVGLDTSTLHRQTTAMLKAGLVERIPDPDGGVARRFRLTETGASRLHEHRDQVLVGLRHILRDWSPEEQAALADNLRRFNEAIESHDARPWPR
jgi:DNA-binding MarR family transcriptional regulator